MAGSADGEWVAQLTPVAAGVANVGVAPLANSDGSPVLEADGVTPFVLPAAEEITVTAGPASTLTMEITG